MGLCHTSLQYGGQEHLDAPPRELLLAQTEEYVEYSRHGAVLKGQEKAVARSKYEEDVLINNHMVSLVIRHCWISYVFCFMDVKRFFPLLSAVYLGIFLERWLMGLQMLLLDGEAELLYRRCWQESIGECHMQVLIPSLTSLNIYMIVQLMPPGVSIILAITNFSLSEQFLCSV